MLKMTGHLMNQVNRQYFERADLAGHRVLIGIQGSSAGCRTSFFPRGATGIHSASSHFILFRQPRDRDIFRFLSGGKSLCSPKPFFGLFRYRNANALNACFCVEAQPLHVLARYVRYALTSATDMPQGGFFCRKPWNVRP